MTYTLELTEEEASAVSVALVEMIHNPDDAHWHEGAQSAAWKLRLLRTPDE